MESQLNDTKSHPSDVSKEFILSPSVKKYYKISMAFKTINDLAKFFQLYQFLLVLRDTAKINEIDSKNTLKFQGNPSQCRCSSIAKLFIDLAIIWLEQININQARFIKLSSMPYETQTDKNNQEVQANNSLQYLCRKFQKKPGLIDFEENEYKALKASCEIMKGEELIQIPFKYAIHSQMSIIQQSPFLQFINRLSSQVNNDKVLPTISKKSTMQIFMDLGRDLASSNSKRVEARKLLLILEDFPSLNSLIYLIQKRFMNLSVHPDNEVELIHKNYLSIIPQNFENHPSHYSKSIKPFHSQIYDHLMLIRLEIDTLHQTILHLMTKTCNNSSFEQFLRIKGKKYNYKSYINSFCYSNISWAVHVLSTYRFTQKKLLPFVNLPNHAHYSNVEWAIDYKNETYSLIALRNIEVGSQIFIRHNKQSMEKIFYKYGVLSIKSACSLSIPLEFNKQEYLIQITYNLSSYSEKGQFTKYVAQKLVEMLQLLNTSTDGQEMITQFFAACFKQEMAKSVKLNKIGEKIKEQSIDNRQKLKILKALKEIISIEMVILHQIMNSMLEIMSHIKK